MVKPVPLPKAFLETPETRPASAPTADSQPSDPVPRIRLQLWTHELVAAHGGVQAYSRHLLQALRTAVGPANIRICSKNDTPAQLRSIASSPFSASGNLPNRIRALGFAMRSVAGALITRPDLVILAHLNFSSAACWLRRISGIPYWCIAHGVESWNLRDPGRIRGLRVAARIFAVSSYTRSRILDEQALAPERVGILPNAFLPEVFRPGPKPEGLLARHGIAPGKKIVLTVARLSGSEQYKGYDQLLRALPEVLASVPEAHYVLVGDGTDRLRIEQLIRSLGIGRSATLTGSVTQRELPDYYNLCDLFAMPSKGEGFGIVYLEALACGKPVLAGNADGSRDPLQNGRLGVLVNPDSVPEIAQALVAILKGTYPLRSLYRPAELRARTIDAFGPERFLAELRRQLADFQRRPVGSVKIPETDLCVGSP